MIGLSLAWPIAAILVLGLLAWALFYANRPAFGWIAPPPAPDETRSGVMRTTLMIPTPSGERLEAWLYRPPGPPAPVILMAPGLGGTKEGPLERIAWALAEQGFAILAFDFRSFGGSEGAGRHDIDLRAHVADYRAVIGHVRAGRIASVDAARIALWGTSFSGASAACAASVSPVEALLLHVPYLGRPSSRPGPIQMLGYIALSFAEIFGNAIAGLIGVKLGPAYITAYGRPGERAFAPSCECISRREETSVHPFWAALPKTYRGGWRNLIRVSGLRHLRAIDPEAALETLRCPTLIIAARQDDMIAIGDTRQIAAGANIRLIEIDAGHFDPYVDPYFAPNLAIQAAFFHEALAAPLPLRELERASAEA